MSKLIVVAASVLGLVVNGQRINALGTAADYSVQVSAKVSSSPPRIVLSWPADPDTTSVRYNVYRKGFGENSWGAAVPVASTNTSYVDDAVSIGTPYEYQIIKVAPLYNAYGYIYSGIE